MTRYARANGSKSCNARVSADPTPWSEMVSPNKRAAESIDDDDVTTPKKEKKTPKKTPKVVKLDPGTPKSLAVLKSPVHETSPLVATTSAKKVFRKTPAKQKDTSSVNTPGNASTPQAGKLSQPSPVQTRSARKKKAELNATLGTPNSKAVSPTKTVKGKNLNSKTTPKTQKSTPKAKGMKNSNKEDFKLELDDEMDSDDLDSDDNMVADHDSDDIDSDDEFIDEEQAAKLKAELQSIINKPVNSKSILKSTKTPIKVTKAAETPMKESHVSQKSPIKAATSTANTPAKETSELGDTAVNGTSSAVKMIKTEASSPVKQEALRTKTPTKQTPAKQIASPGTPKAIPASMKTPVKENSNQVKTPAKENSNQVKTPAKGTPSQAKTPAKETPTHAKTPAKETPIQAKTPAKETPIQAKTPVKGTPSQAKTPAKLTPTQAKIPARETRTPAKETPTAAKTPAKTPAKENPTPAKEKPIPATTPAKEMPAPVKTPAKDKTTAKATGSPAPVKTPKEPSSAETLVKETTATVKTPAKQILASSKTPVKAKETSTPAKTKNSPSLTEISAVDAMGQAITPGQDKETPAKSLTLGNLKLPNKRERRAMKKAKENQAPEESGVSEVAGEATSKDSQARDELVDAKAAKALARKLRWKQKRDEFKKERAAAQAKNNGNRDSQLNNETSIMEKESKGVDNKTVVHDMMKYLTSRQIGLALNRSPKSKSNAALAEEERYVEVRKKLVASGKTDEEIDRDLPRIMMAIQKRLEQTRCLRCRKRGHMQRDCPISGLRPVSKCYKCGDTTHTIKECSIKEEVYTYAECFICRQTGHLTRNCPSNPKGIYPHGGACFKCGDNSHLSKFCPGTKRSQEEKETSEVIHKKVVAGVLNVKQSADADVMEDTVGQTHNQTPKQGNKKRVVKF
uniref:Zinc finger CCHC domain-containing protein n=1 Tax=Daphnia magna TaxID=35525 RepID=A0A0P5R1N6_9CRUS